MLQLECALIESNNHYSGDSGVVERSRDSISGQSLSSSACEALALELDSVAAVRQSAVIKTLMQPITTGRPAEGGRWPLGDTIEPLGRQAIRRERRAPVSCSCHPQMATRRLSSDEERAANNGGRLGLPWSAASFSHLTMVCRWWPCESSNALQPNAASVGRLANESRLPN